MIAVTSTYETVLLSGQYTDAEKVLLMKWLLDRSVELPERLGRVAEVLGADQDSIARGEEERKRKNREAVRRFRAKRKACNDYNDYTALQGLHELHPAPSFPPHPPIIPDPEKQDVEASRTGAGTRTHATPPTLELVLAFAADGAHHPQGKSYPEEWAREWYAYKMASEPPFTDRYGQPIRQWRQKMVTDWQIKERDERKAATGRDGIRRGTFAPQESNKRGLD